MEAKQKSPKEWIILFHPQQLVKYRDYNFPTTSNPLCQCTTFCGDEVSFSSILLACLSVDLYPFPINQPSCWSNLVRYLNTVPGMDSMSLHRPYPNRYTVPMLMKPLSKFSENFKTQTTSRNTCGHGNTKHSRKGFSWTCRLEWVEQWADLKTWITGNICYNMVITKRMREVGFITPEIVSINSM